MQKRHWSNLRGGETMDKMLLIIWGIFLSVRQRLRLFSPPSGEPQVKTHRDKDHMGKRIVNPRKLEDKKKSKQHHLKSAYSSWSVSKQPDYESCATFLLDWEVITHKKRTKNMAHSIPLWIRLLFMGCIWVSSLQDVRIGQSGSVKIIGKMGVVQE